MVEREAKRKVTVEAALLLPNELQGTAELNPIAQLSGRLSELFGTHFTRSMQMRELMQLADFAVPENGQLPLAVSDQLNHVLDRCGFAVEPDRRYGGWAPQPGDEIVIFKADRGGPIDADRPAYRAMKGQVEVATLAAAGDEKLSDEDFESIMNTIRAAEGFSAIERARLLAYTFTLFKSPPKQARVMRRLTECTLAEREMIARAAAAVMVDEPVAISKENSIAGVSISKPKDPAVTIDPVRLARSRKDADAVSKLLTQIFADPAASQDDVQPIAVNGEKLRSSLNGLNIAHAELVEFIEMRGKISRKEFEEQARALKLLPEGALETINEWSRDRFDEPLLEDGDRIIFAVHLCHRLALIRETSS